MCRPVLFSLLAALLSACLELPTIEITPTVGSATRPPTAIATVKPIIIKITGDVYVRDDQDKVIGWINKGDQVQAVCSGDWCRISSGNYNGYTFWRGCSSDNPERRSCQSREK